MAANFSAHTYQSVFNTCHATLSKQLDRLPLWSHQIEALHAIEAYFADTTKTTPTSIILPLNSGKSAIAVMTPYILNVSHVLLITSSISKLKHMHANFCGGTVKGVSMDPFMYKHGIVSLNDLRCIIPTSFCVTKPKKTDPTQMEQSDLVLMTANTLSSSQHKFDHAFDLVIVDDADQYSFKVLESIIDQFKSSKQLFVSTQPLPCHDQAHEKKQDIDISVCYTMTKDELDNMGTHT